MILAMTRICDRCGKVHEVSQTPDKPKYNALRFMRSDAVGTIWSIGSVMDLCPKCMEELQNFMFSGEVHLAEKENRDAKN